MSGVLVLKSNKCRQMFSGTGDNDLNVVRPHDTELCLSSWKKIYHTWTTCGPICGPTEAIEAAEVIGKMYLCETSRYPIISIHRLASLTALHRRLFSFTNPQASVITSSRLFPVMTIMSSACLNTGMPILLSWTPLSTLAHKKRTFFWFR